MMTWKMDFGQLIGYDLETIVELHCNFPLLKYRCFFDGLQSIDSFDDSDNDKWTHLKRHTQIGNHIHTSNL